MKSAYASGATLITLDLAHLGSTKRRGFFLVAGTDGKVIPSGKRKFFTQRGGDGRRRSSESHKEVLMFVRSK